MRRSTCIFSGQVQGVGFRYSAMNLARGYDVVGYVRNLPDGRVELVMEGSDTQRSKYLEELRAHLSDYISAAKVTESPATGEFNRFSILH